MDQKTTILLAAGGTGGHLFPAITVAEELQKSKASVHLITDRRCEKYLTPDLPITAHIIDLHIKMSGLIAKIQSATKLLLACFRAIILVRKLKPSVIVGFGGYPSVPAMMAGVLLNIPIIIHEQNCFFGKSNRLFAKFAKVIALSYKETKNIDKKFESKLIFTGDIVRSKIYNLPTKKNFNAKIFHLFVVGGSQGAKIFSELVPDAIEKLKKLNPDIEISVTQQAAKIDQANISKIYNKLKIKHELAEFFHNMPEIYSKSHLVIARSGAGTIGELTAIGLPAIFIPFPHAAQDHQYFNAKALADSGASWCYKQNEISASILADKLSELILDRKLLTATSKKLLTRKSNGCKYLVDTVLKINR
jgi:UDP-N-acetylglucosamine--N-acetylmuramyl-(pentapeptide) pyrophosphoryl-undecaprenol N-acetylglucosamine transferase